MKSDQAFPSKYLKAADFAGGKRPHFTVMSVVSENLGSDQKLDFKPVMYVSYNGRQMDKGIVINQTNWAAIATDLGDESDNWIGHTIEFFSARVQGPNGMTDGIRCRVIGTPLQQPIATAFEQRPDLLPAAARQFHVPKPLPPLADPPTATPDSFGARTPEPNDDIPF